MFNPSVKQCFLMMVRVGCTNGKFSYRSELTATHQYLTCHMQLWRKQKSILNFGLYWRLHQSQRSLPPGTFFFWVVLNRDEYWKDRQPDGAELEACTVIVITSLHSLSEWYDIPCASHEANQYICAKPVSKMGKKTILAAKV